MTRISEAAAAQFLNYPKNLKGIALIHFGSDWLLMTEAELEQFLIESVYSGKRNAARELKTEINKLLPGLAQER